MNALSARVLTVILLFTLAACAELDPCCVALPGGGHYCLQSTAALAPFDAQQKVEASFNGRRETLIVEIESDAAGLRFIGLTPFGHKLAQVSFNNRTVHSTAMPDKRLAPAALPALLQIALWPLDAVRTGLSASLTLEETQGETGLSRRLLSGDDILLTVTRIGSTLPYSKLHLTIPAVGLELDVENLGAPAGEEP